MGWNEFYVDETSFYSVPKPYEFWKLTHKINIELA